MFELSSYAAGLAKLLAEASSLASIRIRPFNKLVLDYLDIEAEEGENSDRNGSPSWWLRLMCLDLHPMCIVFAKNIYKFICWISMCITSFNPLFILGWCLISIL